MCAFFASNAFLRSPEGKRGERLSSSKHMIAGRMVNQFKKLKFLQSNPHPSKQRKKRKLSQRERENFI